jgi:hypothetical protein
MICLNLLYYLFWSAKISVRDTAVSHQVRMTLVVSSPMRNLRVAFVFEGSNWYRCFPFRSTTGALKKETKTIEGSSNKIKEILRYLEGIRNHYSLGSLKFIGHNHDVFKAGYLTKCLYWSILGKFIAKHRTTTPRMQDAHNEKSTPRNHARYRMNHHQTAFRGTSSNRHIHYWDSLRLRAPKLKIARWVGYASGEVLDVPCDLLVEILHRCKDCLHMEVRIRTTEPSGFSGSPIGRSGRASIVIEVPVWEELPPCWLGAAPAARATAWSCWASSYFWPPRGPSEVGAASCARARLDAKWA